MTEETLRLLLKVTENLERSILARDCPAVVALEGTRDLILSDYDYLRDRSTAEAFEHRAAEHARQIDVIRWVFAVPQVWVIHSHEVLTRAVSNHPLREGEREAITWMAYDRTDGVDYGRLPYERQANGDPIFGEPEVFTVGLQPETLMPGVVLLRTLIGSDDS
jgi:hypothetical protein